MTHFGYYSRMWVIPPTKILLLCIALTFSPEFFIQSSYSKGFIWNGIVTSDKNFTDLTNTNTIFSNSVLLICLKLQIIPSPQSVVRSPQSVFYTDRTLLSFGPCLASCFKKTRNSKLKRKNSNAELNKRTTSRDIPFCSLIHWSMLHWILITRIVLVSL